MGSGEDQATADTEEEPKATRRQQLRGKFRFAVNRWWQWLYYRYPKLIPDPYNSKEARNDQKREDEKENAETRIPEGEELHLQFLMAVEVYGPSEIDSLVRGIQEHGWDWRARNGDTETVVDWIQGLRQGGTSMGFNTLGTVVRRDDKRLVSRRLTGQLPDDVDLIELKVFQITSSLTCLTVTFELQDAYLDRYMSILNRDRQTEKEPLERGYRLWSPERVKERELQKVRSELREKATSWIRRHAPGIFCNGYLGERLLTLELLTTKDADPFPADRGTERQRWMDVLSLSSSYLAWRCDELPQLKVALQDRRGEQRGHCIAAMNVGEIQDSAFEMVGGRRRGAYMYLAAKNLEDLLSRYAALSVLRGFLRRLNRFRDALRGPSSPSRGVDTLAQMEEFFLNGLGIPSVIRELKDLAEHPRLYASGVSSFREVRSLDKDREPRLLVETLREQTVSTCGRLDALDKSARELFIQYGSLVSTTESMRAQKRMERLTYTMMLLTVVSVMFAALAWFSSSDRRSSDEGVNPATIRE